MSSTLTKSILSAQWHADQPAEGDHWHPGPRDSLQGPQCKNRDLNQDKQHLLCIHRLRCHHGLWNTTINKHHITLYTLHKHLCQWVHLILPVECQISRDSLFISLSSQKGNAMLHWSNNKNMFTGLEVPAVRVSSDLVVLSGVPRPAKETLDMLWDCWRASCNRSMIPETPSSQQSPDRPGRPTVVHLHTHWMHLN